MKTMILIMLVVLGLGCEGRIQFTSTPADTNVTSDEVIAFAIASMKASNKALEELNDRLKSSNSTTNQDAEEMVMRTNGTWVPFRVSTNSLMDSSITVKERDDVFKLTDLGANIVTVHKDGSVELGYSVPESARKFWEAVGEAFPKYVEAHSFTVNHQIVTNWSTYATQIPVLTAQETLYAIHHPIWSIQSGIVFSNTIAVIVWNGKTNECVIDSVAMKSGLTRKLDEQTGTVVEP